MKLSTSMDEMIAFNELKAMAGVDVDVKQFDIKSGAATHSCSTSMTSR